MLPTNEAKHQIPHLINILLNGHLGACKALGWHDVRVTLKSTGRSAGEFQGRGEFKVHNFARSLGHVEANTAGREPAVYDADAMQLVQRKQNLEGKAKSTERVRRFPVRERNSQVCAIKAPSSKATAE